MSVHSHLYGHPIQLNTKTQKLMYMDTGKPVHFRQPRECPKCGIKPTNGHDPCIKNLPGVRDACCGHGVGDGYIIFEDGRSIRGGFEVNKALED